MGCLARKYASCIVDIPVHSVGSFCGTSLQTTERLVLESVSVAYRARSNVLHCKHLSVACGGRLTVLAEKISRQRTEEGSYTVQVGCAGYLVTEDWGSFCSKLSLTEVDENLTTVSDGLLTAGWCGENILQLNWA